jgi:hypothetical protein
MCVAWLSAAWTLLAASTICVVSTMLSFTPTLSALSTSWPAIWRSVLRVSAWLLAGYAELRRGCTCVRVTAVDRFLGFEPDLGYQPITWWSRR